MSKPSPRFLLALLPLCLSNPFQASACPICHYGILRSEIVASSGTNVLTAVQTGNFTNAATWDGNRVPGSSDLAVIPSPYVVSVTTTAAKASSVIVDGKLRFGPTANSKLTVENLLVSGTLVLGGTAASGQDVPIAAGVKATIAIVSPTPIISDTLRMSRGIIASPTALVQMNSAGYRDPFVTATGALNSATIATSAVPANWKVNDQLVIPATVFSREWSTNLLAAGSIKAQNEIRTLSGTSAGSITLSSTLAFNHSYPVISPTLNIPMAVHVANLTRDIVIQTVETGTNLYPTGHVMLMTNNVYINGVEFDNLGRTDKQAAVTDPLLSETGTATTSGSAGMTLEYNNGNFTQTHVTNGRYTNPRGRYAVHFHEAGTGAANPAVVSNCVVNGTPGWGFVNHDSSVNFINNVCFDFDGAGFATEDGTETGTFDGNIAIGGVGSGEFSNQREIFGNRARGDQGDTGFNGTGFWLQSPDVTVQNNVAAGCKGSGFFFWCGGRFDPLEALDPSTGLFVAGNHGHFTGKDLSEVTAINSYRSTQRVPPGMSGSDYHAAVVPRYWDFNRDGTADAALITDLPVREFLNNTAYACFTGLRMRFVNHGNTNIFDEIRPGEFGGSLTNQIMPPAATRGRFAVENCTFWNNLDGIHATYVTKADFVNVAVVSGTYQATPPPVSPKRTVAEDRGVGGIGISVFFNNAGCTLNGCRVVNYTTGLRYNGNNVGTAPANIVLTNCLEPLLDSGTTSACKGDDYLSQPALTNNAPDTIY